MNGFFLTLKVNKSVDMRELENISRIIGKVIQATKKDEMLRKSLVNQLFYIYNTLVAGTTYLSKNEHDKCIELVNLVLNQIRDVFAPHSRYIQEE